MGKLPHLFPTRMRHAVGTPFAGRESSDFKQSIALSPGRFMTLPISFQRKSSPCAWHVSFSAANARLPQLQKEPKMQEIAGAWTPSLWP